MKKLLTILLIIASLKSFATNYYFAAEGNDAAGNCTITALTNAGAANTSDTSIIHYLVIN